MACYSLTSNVLSRRKECQTCKIRFSTQEKVKVRHTIYVTKRNKRRQKFDRAKLEASIRLAFANRPLTSERMSRIVDNILFQLNKDDEKTKIGGFTVETERTVDSNYIGHMVLASLKELDKIAYVRFASVFYKFYDLGHFLQIIEMLESGTERPPTES